VTFDPVFDFTGLLVLTQLGQFDGEVVGRDQGVGVVLAQNPAAAGQGVLVQGAGLLVLTQLGQPDGEVISRVQGRSASTDRNPAGTWVKVAVEAGWAALIL
jgi:predicted carbohydrate-binding protein with CBM5 and CBM33 domain